MENRMAEWKAEKKKEKRLRSKKRVAE